MSEQNNSNEPLHFTRKDVERLKAIEINTADTAQNLVILGTKLDSFTAAHLQLHEQLTIRLDDVQRFTKITRRVISWTMRLLAGGGLIWIVDNVARAAGWLK
jgi:hypothetical protein